MYFCYQQPALSEIKTGISFSLVNVVKKILDADIESLALSLLCVASSIF